MYQWLFAIHLFESTVYKRLACIVIFSAQASLQGVSGTGKDVSCTGILCGTDALNQHSETAISCK